VDPAASHRDQLQQLSRLARPERHRPASARELESAQHRERDGQ